ncbi:hypothetical protein, partial [Collinsella stercoris]|uniref:hypothetical protein n=1 Tax=Collinsella stercoris TaxID=147206 RepID=UPI003AEFB86C
VYIGLPPGPNLVRVFVRGPMRHWNEHKNFIHFSDSDQMSIIFFPRALSEIAMGEKCRVSELSQQFTYSS